MYKSAKKKKGMVVGFVSFETAEQLEAATEVLTVNLQLGKQCFFHYCVKLFLLGLSCVLEGIAWEASGKWKQKIEGCRCPRPKLRQ